MENTLIYVVDDEQNIRDLIKTYLLKESYLVEVFSDGETAYEKFRIAPADMLIIDIMMPGMDGYSLCKEIRKSSQVPIIMVSAKDEEIDKILGLELGSDDYMSKPFSPRELVARIRTIFRRINEPSSVTPVIPKNQLTLHDLTILVDERKVLKESTEIDITTKEYDLLYYLAKNKNRVFTRDQLLSGIWGYDYIGDSRAIDDLVKRLRKKLTGAGSISEITTVWGYGYKVSE